MNCQQLIEALNDYVDGEIDPALCEQLEPHLGGCNPCQVVVDTIRKTITLYKGEQEYEIPFECRQRLHAALREKWKQKHPGGETPRA
jgi:anti-sigma factor RsiW